MKLLRRGSGVPVASDFDGAEAPLVVDGVTGGLYSVTDGDEVVYVGGLEGSFEAFGAVGDGATDDGPAVRAALVAALADGSTVRLVGGKTYLCLTWTVIDTTSAVSLVGCGTIRGPVAVADFMRPGGNVYAEGVTFDRWQSVFEREIAETGTITDLQLIGCKFSNCTSIPVNIERPISKYRVIRSQFDTCSGGYALRIGENTYANQDTWLKGEISRNIFTSLTGTGAASTAAILVYGREVQIDGNIIDGVAADSGESWGIFTKARYSRVCDNLIRNISSTSNSDVVGINVKGNTRASTSAPQGFSSVVSGNQVLTVGVNATKGSGIRAQTDDVLIVGNVIEDSGLNGIVTDEASAYYNTKIADNSIRFTTLNIANSGVRIEGGGTGITVLGNTVLNAGLGVRVSANQTAAGLTDVLVANNQLRSCTYPVLFDASTSCTLTRMTVHGNVADGGTAAVLNNGSGGTIVGLKIIDNDFERCTGFLSGLLPAGSHVLTTAIVTTADATLTTVFFVNIADESAFATEARVVGRKSDTTDRGMYHMEALHYRDGGGATLQGAVAEVISAVESNAAWAAAFSVSSNSVLLRVTGVAATTISWKAVIDMVGV